MGSRASAAFAHDVVMAAASFFLSFYLRVGGGIADYSALLLIAYGAAFTATAGIVFLSTGLYRGIWRYASLPDLVALVKAASLVILIYFPLMFLATRGAALPRSLIVINWLLLIALLGGPRFLYRVYKDGSLDHILERTSRVPIPVLLIGAREDSDLFIRTTRRDPERLYRVVGILSDSALRVGRDIGGVPVLGTIADLRAVVERLSQRDDRPQRLIISTRGLGGSEVRGLLDLAGELGIPLARLPRLTDFQETVDAARRIEPIAIEDLLGRPQTVLDRAAMKALVAGRRVLVTGAGGTIGAELTRQIAAHGPAHLALLDNGEYALYGIDREVAENFPALPRSASIGDVRDRRRIDEAFAAERPELVFHAAALKHVPIVEAQPCEGVLTNVLGTRNVAEACRGQGVRAMVMISTDKAVNPGSVMGATKRLAESLCQALDVIEARRAGGTRFMTVRFGNVLGSTGSVVPLFQRQLAAGGPLTVTHPEIERFFMTVREAVELVLEASALGIGEAERGRIYVLDMGQPIRIADLARQMIRLAGLKPDQDVKIEYIGLRPGEKLGEELFHAGETPLATKVPGVLIAAPRTSDYAMLQRPLDELIEQARERNEERALALLATLVPEYRPPQAPRAAAAPSLTR